MSYKCFICVNPVKAGISCHKRVLKKRTKHYSERPHSKREWRFDKGKWKRVWIPDPGGVGFETVLEVACCPSCASKIDNGDL